MDASGVDPGSFRDRKSRVFYHQGDVFRALSEEAFADWEVVSSADFFRARMDDGAIVHTAPVDLDGGLLPAGAWRATLRHERIPFVSYPYEWSFTMLQDAALLHLELLIEALRNGFVIKDSSAFNMQWRGSQVTFIDTPSFERLTEGEPWIGYRQFCEMFLYPLLLQAYKGVDFRAWLRGDLNGIPPGQFVKMMSGRDRLRPGVLTHGVLHARAEARFANTPTDLRSELQKVGFRSELIVANATRLAAIIRRLESKQTESEWSDYTQSCSYEGLDRARKGAFVEQHSQSRNWDLVWDLGANTGEYSRIVAENASYVVAMDADPLVVDRLYRQLREEGHRSILPLVVDIANPSPNLGWRGRERRSLVDRQRPDLVLALAVVHHLAITHNVPLAELVEWLAGLGASLIIEFVGRDDPMAKRLLANRRDDVHIDYDVASFRRYLGRHFEIRAQEQLGSGTRELFFAVPRAA